MEQVGRTGFADLSHMTGTADVRQQPPFSHEHDAGGCTAPASFPPCTNWRHSRSSTMRSCQNPLLPHLLFTLLLSNLLLSATSVRRPTRPAARPRTPEPGEPEMRSPGAIRPSPDNAAMSGIHRVLTLIQLECDLVRGATRVWMRLRCNGSRLWQGTAQLFILLMLPGPTDCPLPPHVAPETPSRNTSGKTSDEPVVIASSDVF